MYASGIIFAVASLAGAGITFAMEDQASGVPAMLAILCGLCVIGGVAMIASGARTRVVLHEDAIEVFGIYRESRLARAEILGCHTGGGSRPGAQADAASYLGRGAHVAPSLAVDASSTPGSKGSDNLDAQGSAGVDRPVSRDDSGSVRRKKVAADANRGTRGAGAVLADAGGALGGQSSIRTVHRLMASHAWRAAVGGGGARGVRGSVYRLDSEARCRRQCRHCIAMFAHGFALLLRARSSMCRFSTVARQRLTAARGSAVLRGLVCVRQEERQRLGSQLSVVDDVHHLMAS
jgi:hypothetical protein